MLIGDTTAQRDIGWRIKWGFVTIISVVLILMGSDSVVEVCPLNYVLHRSTVQAPLPLVRKSG